MFESKAIRTVLVVLALAAVVLVFSRAGGAALDALRRMHGH